MHRKFGIVVLGLTLAALTGRVEVKAGLIDVQYAGGGVVTITSSGDSGTFGAGPFNLTDTTTGQSLQAFCVDLKTVVSGDLYKGLSATTYAPLSTIGQGAIGFSDSAYSDVGNRLAYAMGSLFAQQPHSWDSDELGGFQAALWHVVDKNFSLVWADSNLTGDYNTFVSLIGGPGSSGASQTDRAGNLYAGFTEGVTYSGGELFWMSPQGAYQNLVAYDPTAGPNFQPAAVPEPSSLGMAVVSAMGFLFFWSRRRGA